MRGLKPREATTEKRDANSLIVESERIGYFWAKMEHRDLEKKGIVGQEISKSCAISN